MSSTKKFEFGIVGTSLFSAFLAGLLAKNHAKKTALFLDFAVQHQIAREINVTFDCQTRPETWQMLQKSIGEALPILGKIGGSSATAKTDALLVCQTQYSRDALSHMYHFLHGQEYDIERLSGNEIQNSLATYRLSRLRAIRPNALWPALLSWLNTIGVPIFNTRGMRLKIRKDGFAKFSSSKMAAEISNLVLADEQSILNYASERAISQLFTRVSKFSVLSQPVAGFSERLVLNPEGNFSARQKLDKTIEILSEGNSDEISTRINNNLLSSGLVQQPVIRLSGRSLFSTLKTKDGATMVGKMARTGVWGCAGLGMGSVFFAPMIARYICGQPSETEMNYFLPRCGDGRRKSHLISDGCTPVDGL